MSNKILAVAQTHPIKGDILKNIENHKRLIDIALSCNADTVIFPELSLTGYEPELAQTLAIAVDDSRLAVFQDISNTQNLTIGVGVPLKQGDDTYSQMGNICLPSDEALRSSFQVITISMIIFKPYQPRQVYSKKYLHSSEIPFFVSGDNVSTFINSTKIALAICYEISVAQHAKDAFDNGAEYYIASVVEDNIDKAITKLSITAAQYNMTILMANAVGQTGAYFCNGKSSIFGRDGKILGQLDAVHEGVLVINTETDEVFIKE